MRKTQKIKRIISILLIIAGIVCGVYVGAWLLFIKPIMAICMAIDSGSVTAMVIGMGIIKFLLASPVAGVIIYIGFIFGNLVDYLFE